MTFGAVGGVRAAWYRHHVGHRVGGVVDLVGAEPLIGWVPREIKGWRRRIPVP
jgi:hypothetical protein